MDNEKLEPFLSVREAAELLGLPRWKVWKAVQRRQIKSYHFVNQRILVRASEILKMIETSASETHHSQSDSS